MCEFKENLELLSVYCGNEKTMMIKEYYLHAIKRKYVQHNRPNNIKWIVIDIDEDGAYFRPEERSFPKPNFTCINRENGHAHLGYLLDTGIHKYGKSQEALRFYKDVRYGVTKRLGGDFGYNNFICKNPLNNFWEVEYNDAKKYSLGELNEYLDKNDKIRLPVEYGLFKRNSTIFENVRIQAYKLWRKNRENWEEMVFQFAFSINDSFSIPLDSREVKSICERIIRFITMQFSENRFSKIQSFRAKKTWEGVETINKNKPWINMNISRATYFRRQQAVKAG